MLSEKSLWMLKSLWIYFLYVGVILIFPMLSWIPGLGFLRRGGVSHSNLATTEAPAMAVIDVFTSAGAPCVARYQAPFTGAATDSQDATLTSYPADGNLLATFKCPGKHEISVQNPDGEITIIKEMVQPSDDLKDLYPEDYQDRWSWIFQHVEPNFTKWAQIISSVQKMHLYGLGSVFGPVPVQKDGYTRLLNFSHIDPKTGQPLVCPAPRRDDSDMLVDILKKNPRTGQPLVSPGAAIHHMLRWFRDKRKNEQEPDEVAALDTYLCNKLQAVVKPALARACALRRTMVNPEEVVVNHNFFQTLLGDMISAPKVASILMINGLPLEHDVLKHQLVEGEGHEAYTISIWLKSSTSSIVVQYKVGDTHHEIYLKLGEETNGQWGWLYSGEKKRRFFVNWKATAKTGLGYTIPNLVKGKFQKTPVCAHGTLSFSCTHASNRYEWSVNYDIFIKPRHIVRIGRAEAYWSRECTCGGTYYYRAYINAVVTTFLLCVGMIGRSFKPLPLELGHHVLGFVPLLQLGELCLSHEDRASIEI